MEIIPLESLASGQGADAYPFTLLMERGQGFCEIKIADSDGNPLSPRVRLENINGVVRLFVWDVTAQDTPGNHPPPYSHQQQLLQAGRTDPPRRLDSLVLAHAPVSSP